MNSDRLSCWSGTSAPGLRLSLAALIGSVPTALAPPLAARPLTSFLPPFWLRSTEPLAFIASSELAMAKWRVNSSALYSLVMICASLPKAMYSMMPILVADAIEPAPAIDEPQ